VINHIVKTQNDHAYKLQFCKLERLTDGTFGRVLLPSHSSLNNVENLSAAYVCRYLKYHDQQFVLQKRKTKPIAQDAVNIWETFKFRNIGDKAPSLASPIAAALPQAGTAANVLDVEKWMQGLDIPDNLTIDAMQISQLTPTKAVQKPLTKEELTPQKAVLSQFSASINKENVFQKASEPFAVNAHPWETVKSKPWTQKIVDHQPWGDGPGVTYGASGQPRTSRATHPGSIRRGNSGVNTVRNQIRRQTREPPLLELALPIDISSSHGPILVAPPPGYIPQSLGLSSQPPKSPSKLASNTFGSAQVSSESTKSSEVPGPVPPVAIRRFEGKKNHPSTVTPLVIAAQTKSNNSSAPAASNEIYMVLKQVPVSPDFFPIFEKPPFADMGVVERLQPAEDRNADNRVFRRTRHNKPSPAVPIEAQNVQYDSGIGRSQEKAEHVTVGIYGNNLSSSDILERLLPANEDEVGQRPFMHTMNQKKPSKASKKIIYTALKQTRPNPEAAMVSLRASYAETTAGRSLRNTNRPSQSSGQPGAIFSEAVPNSTYPLGDPVNSLSNGTQLQQRSTVPAGLSHPGNDSTSMLEHTAATLPTTSSEEAVTDNIRVDPTPSSDCSIAPPEGMARATPPTDKPSRTANPKLAQSVRAGLEIARSFRGAIIIESQIGQILLATVPKHMTEAPFDASELPPTMSNIQGFQSSGEAFTSHVSTSHSDMLPLLDRPLLGCCPFTLGDLPISEKAVYEFICTCSDKKQITVIIDAIGQSSDSGASSYVVEKEKILAATYLHFPQRVWDARISVRGEVRASLEEYEGVKELIDSVYVRVSDPGGMPEILGRDGAALTVDCVRIRLMLNYATAMSACRTHFLRLTKIQELTVCRYESDMLENRGLFRTAPEDEASMINDHRLWFEASLGMSEAKQFQQNTTLELGGEVSWTVDDVVSEGDLRILESKTVTLVEMMDGVGYHNKGIGARKELKFRKQKADEKKAEQEREQNAPW